MINCRKREKDGQIRQSEPFHGAEPILPDPVVHRGLGVEILWTLVQAVEQVHRLE